jgi:hypothetical protein
MNWTDLTWAALKTWMGLAVLILLVMHLFGKGIVEFLRTMWVLWRGGDPNDPWKARGLVINLVSFVLALVVASLHINGEYTFGDAFVAALVATAAATFGHEAIKNVLGLFGQEERINDPLLRIQ